LPTTSGLDEEFEQRDRGGQRRATACAPKTRPAC
jgi:hypothetical protein